MIVGEVRASREAVILAHLRGPAGIEVEVDAVIDTGFTDSLTLPPSIVSSLSLHFDRFVDIRLADDSIVTVEAYGVTVLWDGAERIVAVYAMDGGPLIGMSLLYGNRITIDAVDGGTVTIERIS